MEATKTQPGYETVSEAGHPARDLFGRTWTEAEGVYAGRVATISYHPYSGFVAVAFEGCGGQQIAFPVARARLLVDPPKGPALTAAAVGKRLLVAPRTVKKWVDSGRLKGRVTPTGEYKIPPASFAAFCAEYGLTVYGTPAGA